MCIFEQEHSMQAVCMDDLGMNRSQSWHPYSQWVHMHAQVKSPCHNQKNSQGTHRVMSSRQGYQSFSQKKNGTCQQYSAAWKNLKAIQSQAWNSRSRHSCPWGWARNQRAIPTCSCRRKSGLSCALWSARCSLEQVADGPPSSYLHSRRSAADHVSQEHVNHFQWPHACLLRRQWVPDLRLVCQVGLTRPPTTS